MISWRTRSTPDMESDDDEYAEPCKHGLLPSRNSIRRLRALDDLASKNRSRALSIFGRNHIIQHRAARFNTTV